MATPTPNEWNPNTTTVYSSSGSAKEIPLAEYDKFIGKGWGATAPSAEAPETETPKVEEEAKLPSPVEVPKDISTEQLEETELPDLMAQNAGLDKPWYGLKDTFGEEWTPPPIFEQLGLVDQGIYGAVRVKGMIDTYTIGPGGRLETPESFQERFGTLEQAGIVNEVSIEEAKKLGINIEADSLMSDVTEEIPESFTAEMTPEQKAQVGTDILAAAEIKYGVEGLKKEKDDATTKLINTIKGMWEKFEVAKEEKEEKLEMEEKNKAISDAQTSYTKVKSVYDKYINELTHSTMTTAHIGGLQAKARSQMAVELAPLSAAIQIAQGNWDRGKEILDDFSDDWKQAQEWNLQAAQMKINMLGENLSEAQQKSKTEAQNKLDWAREDYQQKLADRDQIMSLMVAYPQAGISLNTSLSDAFKSIMPFMASDKELEDKMKMIGLESAEIGLLIDKKNLAKPFAPTKAPGLTPTQLLARENKFWQEIDDGMKRLQKGDEWGVVWNRVKNQFPEYSNEQIDQALRGGIRIIQPTDEFGQPISAPATTEEYGWAKPGAYEEYKAKQEEGKAGVDSKWERESTVWQWMETDEAKNLSDEEKASQIRSYGLNPETFGIY